MSPEQISHRLKVDHPDNESMRVSRETIYQAIYFQARGGLRREVQAALRTGRAVRKPQTHGVRRPRLVDPMIMISDRPASVEQPKPRKTHDWATPAERLRDLLTS